MELAHLHYIRVLSGKMNQIEHLELGERYYKDAVVGEVQSENISLSILVAWPRIFILNSFTVLEFTVLRNNGEGEKNPNFLHWLFV